MFRSIFIYVCQKNVCTPREAESYQSLTSWKTTLKVATNCTCRLTAYNNESFTICHQEHFKAKVILCQSSQLCKVSTPTIWSWSASVDKTTTIDMLLLIQRAIYSQPTLFFLDMNISPTVIFTDSRTHVHR